MSFIIRFANSYINNLRTNLLMLRIPQEYDSLNESNIINYSKIRL